MAGELTSKQLLFIEETVIGSDGQNADGGGHRSRRKAGSILANIAVQQAISEAVETRPERTRIKKGDVVAELAKVGFANMLDYFRIEEGGAIGIDLTRLTRDQAAAIVEVSESGPAKNRTIRLKLGDKLSALEKLGRHMGIFAERHDERPKRLDEMDSDEIRALLGDSLPDEYADRFADEPPAGERQRKLN